jgi:hypothetical protein
MICNEVHFCGCRYPYKLLADSVVHQFEGTSDLVDGCWHALLPFVTTPSPASR